MRLSILTLTILSTFALSNGKHLLADAKVEPAQGDKLVILGNTLAERMQYFNHFETLLHARFSDKQLVVRNLGWSADQIDQRMRSQDFKDHGHTLIDHQPNIILAMFGFNESFAGEAGVAAFEQKLANFVEELNALKYPYATYKRGSYTPQMQDKDGTPQNEVRVVLISPAANEDLPERGITAGTNNNPNLALYAGAIERVAKAKGVPFVDLYTLTKKLLEKSDEPLTINGIHFNDEGYRQVAKVLDQELFGGSL